MTAIAPPPIRRKLIVGDIQVRGSATEMDDDEFFLFCRKNDELRIERDKNGNILIMPPTNFEAGSRENKVAFKLNLWNWQTRSGVVFGSSTGFTLPNSAIRSPDAAWISNELAATISEKEKQGFARVVPEFVVEVRSSRTDNLEELKTKMTDDWMANGVQLAWLLDPIEEKAWIYRADGSIDVVTGFDKKLSGEGVLPGFEFELSIL